MWQPSGKAPGPESALHAPLRLVLRSGFCQPELRWLAKWEQTPPTPEPYVCWQLWINASFSGKKKKNNPNFSWCSRFCVEILPPALVLLCERPPFQFFNPSSAAVWSASQVGWPQPFLKQYIMSLITYLSGMLSWDFQGLLDNPHPFPWEEQHHKDQ